MRKTTWKETIKVPPLVICGECHKEVSVIEGNLSPHKDLYGDDCVQSGKSANAQKALRFKSGLVTQREWDEGFDQRDKEEE